MSAGLARIFVELAVLVAIGAGVYFERQAFGAARYQAGYDQANSEAAAEAGKRDRESALEKAADEKRIADAYRAKDMAQAQLAAVRARPVPRLVCRRAEDPPGADGVPTTAELPASGSPGARTFQEAPGGGSPATFDPTPRLRSRYDEADDLLEQCRLLNDAVHGAEKK